MINVNESLFLKPAKPKAEEFPHPSKKIKWEDRIHKLSSEIDSLVNSLHTKNIRSVKLDPFNVVLAFIHYKLGEIANYLELFSTAAEEYKTALTLNKSDFSLKMRTFFSLHEMLTQQGSSNETLKVMQTALQFLDEGERPVEDTEVNVDQLRVEFRDGIERALNTFKKKCFPGQRRLAQPELVSMMLQVRSLLHFKFGEIAPETKTKIEEYQLALALKFYESPKPIASQEIPYEQKVQKYEEILRDSLSPEECRVKVLYFIGDAFRQQPQKDLKQAAQFYRNVLTVANCPPTWKKAAEKALELIESNA